MRSGQTQRILQHLLQRPNEDVPAVDLHRAGSGIENGWCGSLSRRISDLRKLGYVVVVSRDETVNGQRHTWYSLKYKPIPSQTKPVVEESVF